METSAVDEAAQLDPDQAPGVDVYEPVRPHLADGGRSVLTSPRACVLTGRCDEFRRLSIDCAFSSCLVNF